MGIDSLLASADTPRPEKRRRILMDAVVVPFDHLARVHANADRQVRADMEHQALHDKFELLKNPKVKKSKDAPVLSLDTVMARLSAHGINLEPYPIDLEPEIRDVTVRRDFMSQEYGGNRQDTRPPIGEDFWMKTGLRNFMYLNLDFNPRCPEIPGAPGLLFNVACPGDSDIDLSKLDDKDDTKRAKKCKPNKKNEKAKEDKKTRDEDKTEILFARLDTHMWQYQGQYVTASAKDLTIEEWKRQPLKVRRTWVRKLSLKKWGRPIRAEVALRRELGRRPTRAEKTTALKDKKNKFLAVTPEDISKAFNRGEVVIKVSTMKCVGYNADFQRVLAEKMPLFIPDPSKGKNTGSNSKPEPAVKPSSAKHGVPSVSRGKKRARQELENHDDFEDDFENDSDVVPESEDEDEGPQETVYRSRGTRSRPIVLGKLSLRHNISVFLMYASIQVEFTRRERIRLLVQIVDMDHHFLLAFSAGVCFPFLNLRVVHFTRVRPHVEYAIHLVPPHNLGRRF
ncbi:hypothetical protein B0H12DRAFT_409650 [Mycena haematopus]|nr:hypothetical protein B0H12DRAFT_409650 [Mycena haematopus]